ncbi:hypothetical protein F4774DRAFT_375499 [Daldinia eschscholtzii]|nr:hypothetical protein F4774DRAFT_375499 [Daldinia eschscholtzii]
MGMMPEHKYEEYHLLGQDEEPASDLPTHNERLHTRSLSQPSRLLHKDIWKVLAIGFTFLLSLVAGLFIGSRLQKTSQVNATLSYFKAVHSQTNTLWWNTEYSAEDADNAVLNQLWDITIPWESGIIALSNEESEALNLPDSQPFPWDASRKKLYIINAHHLLHCVRNIYISIQQYRTNRKQTISYPHILHCLDSLRVETMCAADDTLRYVPLNSVHGFRPGDGQQRKCRDWNKLQEFAESHNPCYRYLQPGNATFSNLERFKFCSEESGYLPKIRKYFGYSADWAPEAPEGPRELEW